MLDRHISQLGYVASDIAAIRVEPLRLTSGIEDPKVGRGIGPAAGDPLPIELVLGNVAVAQAFHEPPSAVPPPDVQVLDQERGNDHPDPIVHPALRLQLTHPGVDQGIARRAFLPRSEPLCRDLARVGVIGWHRAELVANRLAYRL